MRYDKHPVFGGEVITKINSGVELSQDNMTQLPLRWWNTTESFIFLTDIHVNNSTSVNHPLGLKVILGPKNMISFHVMGYSRR